MKILAAIFACAFVLGLGASATPAAAADLAITVLETSDRALITDPELSGEWVVWLERDVPHGRADVCAMNLVTDEKIVLAHDRSMFRHAGALCTDGSLAAWVEYNDEDPWPEFKTEIWFADLGTGQTKQLTDDAIHQAGLSIGAGHVVWREGSEESIQTLVAYDVSTEATSALFVDRLVAGTAITDAAAYFFVAEGDGWNPKSSLRSVPLGGGADTVVIGETYPWFLSRLSISGNTAVWEGADPEAGGRATIYSATLSGGVPSALSLGPDWPQVPDSDDRHVAWVASDDWTGIDRLVVRDARDGLVQPIYSGIDESGPTVDAGRCIWSAGPSLFLANLSELPAAVRIAGRNRVETGLAAVQSEFRTARTVVFASAYSSADALSAAGLAGATDGCVVLVGATSPYAVASEVRRLRPERILIVGGPTAVPQESIATACWQAQQQLGTTIERIAGRTRYDTSHLVNDRILAEGGDPNIAFVVRGNDFADGLAVAPAAYQLGARTFLVAPDSVPPATASSLTTVPAEAIIVGGERAVGPEVQDWFGSKGSSVTRIAGSTRFATNIAFADHAVEREWLSSAHVGVCNGLAYPDALSGGSVIGHAGGPMLYVARDAVPEQTVDFFARRSAELRSARVFGGTGVVSSSVMTWVEKAVPTE